MLVRERKMSEIEQKWSPGVSLEQADAFIKNLAIPVVGEEVTTEYGLDFTNLMNADNKELLKLAF